MGRKVGQWALAGGTVSQSEPRIERYRRLTDDRWEYTEFTEGVLELSTGAVRDVEALYESLPD